MPLRGPDGSRVYLTGAWALSETNIAYLYQSGSCVWWSGEFQGPEPLGRITIVFRGEIASDFTVSGDWSVVRGPTPTWGTATFEIGWQGNGETVTLEPIISTGFYPLEGIMTKISDDVPLP